MKWLQRSTSLLVLGLYLGFSATSIAKTEIDRVIALVDDEVILKSEFQRSYRSIVNRLQQAGQALPNDDKLREQILDKLILDAILNQMAVRAGFRVDDAMLNEAIADIAKQQNLTVNQFRQQLIASGQNFELFREDLRKEVAATQVRNGSVRQRIFISEQEIDSIIELINKEGEQRNEYHIGHILIDIKQRSDKETIEKRKQKAIELVAKLRAGADFKQVAIGESSGPNALNGGDFGWRTIAQMPSLFVDPVKQLKSGGVSDPIRSGSGYHIVKLFEIKGEQRVITQQMKARHILIKPDLLLTDAQALEKITSIRQDIIDGKVTFEDMAKEHSQDYSNAQQGGDLGWSNPSKFVPEFSQAMTSAAIDEITMPVKTSFGYHIIKVEGRRAQDETDEAMRNRAQQILYGRKFDEALESFLRESKESAYIKIIE
jgi:peptidyl-prolyl cis-trans isomerase SurA